VPGGNVQRHGEVYAALERGDIDAFIALMDEDVVRLSAYQSEAVALEAAGLGE